MRPLTKSILWASLATLVAATLIFFKYNQIPAYTTWDEVEFARLAVQLGEQPYTPYSEYATGHATPYFYIILASFKLFGLHEAALRFPSAAFGVLASLALYGVFSLIFAKNSLKLAFPGTKRTLEIPLAFILALVFITLRWFFGFARFSFEATFVLFLELASLYAIILFTQKPTRILALITSAIFAGLAYNSYQPGRLFFIIPVLILIINPKTRNWRNLAVFGGVFALLIAPLTLYLSQNQDIRLKQQLYLADQNLTVTQKITFFFDNVWRNTKLFFLEGDASGRHNYPFKAALNPIIALLSLIGFLSALKNITKRWNLIFLTFFAIAMGPTLLTYPHENPNMLRTVTVLPSLIYFVGLGIQWLHIQLKKADTKKVLTPFFGTIIVLTLLTSSVFELRTYFVFQRPIFEEAFEIRDRFGGVYFMMKEQGIDINQYRIPEDQIEKFNSVPGPDPQQIYYPESMLSK